MLVTANAKPKERIFLVPEKNTKWKRMSGSPEAV